MNSTYRCPSTRPISPSQSRSTRPRRPAMQANPAPRHKADPSPPRLTAKLKRSNKPKKVRLTPEERKARAADQRRKLKALGLCKDCRQRAIRAKPVVLTVPRNTGNRGSVNAKCCTPEVMRGFRYSLNGVPGVRESLVARRKSFCQLFPKMNCPHPLLHSNIGTGRTTGYPVQSDQRR